MSMSFFQNIGKVVITGGTFTQQAIIGPTGLQLLKDSIPTGASHDSEERYPPPRCHPETRTSIINTITEWVADPDRSSHILWLYGPAGVGKSAIAQTVAETLADMGQLGASYFFSRLVVGRNTAKHLFKDVAYQLAHSVNELAPIIDDMVRMGPSIVDKSIDIQLENLIVGPFAKVFDPAVDYDQRWTITVIIDGLDECQGEESQLEVIDLIGTVARQLPICFLIASRPETWIMDAFDDEDGVLKPITFRCELNHSTTVDDDIRTYLVAEFSRIRESRRHRRTMQSLPRPWPSPETIQMLVGKASGQFVFASTVIKFVDDPYNRPSDQLDKVLGIPSTSRLPSPSQPFAELDKLYWQILSNSHNTELMLQILAIIQVIIDHAATEYLIQFAFLEDSEGSSEKLLNLIEQLLDLKSGDSYIVLRDVNSLLYLPDPTQKNQGHLRFFHASFFQFLQDKERCRELYVDSADTHAEIASGCLRLMTGPPPRDAIVQDYFGWIYSIFHWEYHWMHATPTPVLLQRLSNFDLESGFINVLCMTSLPMDLDRFREVLLSISDKYLTDRVPKGHFSSHFDRILDVQRRLQLTDRWPASRPIYDRFILSLDALFHKLLAQSGPDIETVLVILCAGGWGYNIPESFVSTLPGVVASKGGLRTVLAPLEPFLRMQPGFSVQPQAFWEFLTDKGRAREYYLSERIHASAAEALLDNFLQVPSVSDFDRKYYFERCSNLLDVSSESRSLVDTLDFVSAYISKSFPAASPSQISRPKFVESDLVFTAFHKFAESVVSYLERDNVNDTTPSTRVLNKWEAIVRRG